MISYRAGFRNACTDAPATASTSGCGSLAAPRRFAKSKIHTSSNQLSRPLEPGLTDGIKAF
jgi:hypothetical protein